MRFSGIHGFPAGTLMFAEWAFFLAIGSVPELRSAPPEIAAHLAAEGLTALGLVVAGTGSVGLYPGRETARSRR